MHFTFNTRGVAALLVVAASLFGCQAEKLPAKLVPAVSPVFPADQSVIGETTPEFSWTSTVAPAGPSDYTVEVYNAADDTLAFAETVTSSGSGTKQAQFQSHPLTVNLGYYWRVLTSHNQTGTPMVSDPVAFFLAEDPNLVSTDILACENNLVANASFLTASDWVVLAGASTGAQSPGDEDDGRAELSAGTGTVQTLSQQLPTAIESGKNYALHVSMRFPKGDYPAVQLKAWAYNGQPSNLEPGPDVALIGMTPPIPNIGSWSRVSFDIWQAPQGFDSIAFTLADTASLSLVELDRICLVETDESPCAVEVGDESTIQSYLGQGAVETVWEYDQGAVQDLYPNVDTSTADWYEELPAQQQACFSVGGSVPQAQADEISDDLNDEATEDFFEESDDFTEQFKSTTIGDLEDPDIRPITEVAGDCSKNDSYVSDSRPFGGRDIVYIHGLQFAAVTDGLNANRTFVGKWPLDTAAFGPNGGQYYDHAKTYWEEHIKRGLGSDISPSNSYLIVSYAANQRLNYGIHAVLSQINDAITQNSSSQQIVWANGNAGSCFGSNGIVLVTHSTGALLASSMLGVAWESATSAALQADYGDVSHIAERIDAHVSINGALRGSELATAGLMIANGTTVGTLGNTVNAVASFFPGINPVDLINIRNELNDGLLVDLTPQISAQWGRQFYGLSRTPTLTLSGGFPGLGQGTALTWAGKFLLPGFDDGVLTMASQSGSIWGRHYFNSVNNMKLYDMGVPLAFKRAALALEQTVGTNFGSPLRQYGINARLSQTGMVQSGSFSGYVTQPAFWPNHYPVLQTTGDHFDDVNEVDEQGVDYQPSISGNIRNFEESKVVMSSQVYNNGLLSADFPALERQVVREKTIGLHLPHFNMVWVKKKIFGIYIKLPKITVHWVYHHIVVWRRHYHLLEGHETKTGMDYMYEHVLSN